MIMKYKFNILSIAFTCIISSTTIIDAMSFAVNKNYNYNLIYASGYIKYGDYYRLKRKYAKLPHNKQTIVVFNSLGGELEEGLKIGRFLKRNRIGSAVRKNGICASSCAMAFLGGRSKAGKRLMILPENAKLGFHSFYYKNGNYVRVSKIQKDISNILNYASYVGAPSYLMAKMFSTNSNGMYFVNYRDKYALGIKSGIKTTGYKRVSNSYITANTYKSIQYSKSAKEYIKEYLKKFNNLIVSYSGNLYYSNNRALNSSGYNNWLANNLRYIYIENIKEKKYNTVEAKVIYSLKNGLRICSVNRYTLSRTYNNKWKIIQKQHQSCSYKNKKILRKIAKNLP